MSDDELVAADRAAVQKLYSERGIIPVQERDFQCPNLSACQAAAKLNLITGSWPYVGTAYGQAGIDGRLVKILFVAMDIGGKYEPRGFVTTQHEYQCGAEKPTNPHMGSVHCLLRQLVDDKTPALFSRQFALTNAVKCSRRTGKMVTQCPTTMMTKCAGHLEKEVKILQPELIIAQGIDPSRAVSQSPRFSGEQPMETFQGDGPGKAQVFRSRDNIILLTTPHSRIKGLKWSRGKLPVFLSDAVERVRREFAAMA